MRLSKACCEVLDNAAPASVGVSAISFLEVGQLVRSGKLQLPAPLETWLEDIQANPRLKVIPLTGSVAIQSTLLPGELHKDPADRLLIAEARAQNCILVTEDRVILAYPHVRAMRPADFAAAQPD